MTKNQKKVTSLILAIVLVLGFTVYKIFGKDIANFISQHHRIFSTSADSNDSWVGETFYGLKNLKAVKAKEYLISTADKRASEAGAEILAKGGNAIDAAIAAQMVLNVVEPQSSGIGGGTFILYYDAKSKQTIYFNGRETAPAKAHRKIFLNEKNEPRAFSDVVRGGISVGTPGTLKALKEVHEKYGKLPWRDLFNSAVKIADEGFPMDEKITTIAKEVPYLKDSPEFASLYLKEDGTPKDLGTIIKNPHLAKTLADIAQNGIDSFYSGKIADDIVAAVKNSKVNPGYLEKSDLEQYQIKEGELICANYRIKYKICSMPLPSSGGITLLETLGILENFDLSSLKPSSLKAVHLIAEASKLAYADRNEYVADVSDVPIAEMLDKTYLKSRSKLIDMDKAMENPEPGKFGDIKLSYAINKNDSERPSTTHLSIVDKEGNSVSMTSSIEYLFGSVLMVDGFMLNNQLTDFSFVPEIDGKPVANRVEPGKQPRSSMTPVFVFDQNDNLIMVVGSPGGPRIIQFVLKTIIAHLDWNLDIQAAISLPNFVALKGVLELEKGTELEKFAPDFTKMGHKVQILPITSGIHGITMGVDGLTGGADPRRHGEAVGQ